MDSSANPPGTTSLVLPLPVPAPSPPSLKPTIPSSSQQQQQQQQQQAQRSIYQIAKLLISNLHQSSFEQVPATFSLSSDALRKIQFSIERAKFNGTLVPQTISISKAGNNQQNDKSNKNSSKVPKVEFSTQDDVKADDRASINKNDNLSNNSNNAFMTNLEDRCQDVISMKNPILLRKQVTSSFFSTGLNVNSTCFRNRIFATLSYLAKNYQPVGQAQRQDGKTATTTATSCCSRHTPFFLDIVEKTSRKGWHQERVLILSGSVLQLYHFDSGEGGVVSRVVCVEDIVEVVVVMPPKADGGSTGNHEGSGGNVTVTTAARADDQSTETQTLVIRCELPSSSSPSKRFDIKIQCSSRRMQMKLLTVFRNNLNIPLVEAQIELSKSFSFSKIFGFDTLMMNTFGGENTAAKKQLAEEEEERKEREKRDKAMKAMMATTTTAAANESKTNNTNDATESAESKEKTKKKTEVGISDKPVEEGNKSTSSASVPGFFSKAILSSQKTKRLQLSSSATDNKNNNKDQSISGNPFFLGQVIISEDVQWQLIRLPEYEQARKEEIARNRIMVILEFGMMISGLPRSKNKSEKTFSSPSSSPPAKNKRLILPFTSTYDCTTCMIEQKIIIRNKPLGKNRDQRGKTNDEKNDADYGDDNAHSGVFITHAHHENGGFLQSDSIRRRRIKNDHLQAVSFYNYTKTKSIELAKRTQEIEDAAAATAGKKKNKNNQSNNNNNSKSKKSVVSHPAMFLWESDDLLPQVETRTPSDEEIRKRGLFSSDNNENDNNKRNSNNNAKSTMWTSILEQQTTQFPSWKKSRRMLVEHLFLFQQQQNRRHKLLMNSNVNSPTSALSAVAHNNNNIGKNSSNHKKLQSPAGVVTYFTQQQMMLQHQSLNNNHGGNSIIFDDDDPQEKLMTSAAAFFPVASSFFQNAVLVDAQVQHYQSQIEKRRKKEERLAQRHLHDDPVASSRKNRKGEKWANSSVRDTKLLSQRLSLKLLLVPTGQDSKNGNTFSGGWRNLARALVGSGTEVAGVDSQTTNSPFPATNDTTRQMENQQHPPRNDTTTTNDAISANVAIFDPSSSASFRSNMNKNNNSDNSHKFGEGDDGVVSPIHLSQTLALSNSSEHNHDNNEVNFTKPQRQNPLSNFLHRGETVNKSNSNNNLNKKSQYFYSPTMRTSGGVVLAKPPPLEFSEKNNSNVNGQTASKSSFIFKMASAENDDDQEGAYNKNNSPPSGENDDDDDRRVMMEEAQRFLQEYNNRSGNINVQVRDEGIESKGLPLENNNLDKKQVQNRRNLL